MYIVATCKDWSSALLPFKRLLECSSMAHESLLLLCSLCARSSSLRFTCEYGAVYTCLHRSRNPNLIVLASWQFWRYHWRQCSFCPDVTVCLSASLTILFQSLWQFSGINLVQVFLLMWSIGGSTDTRNGPVPKLTISTVLHAIAAACALRNVTHVVIC